MKMELQKTGPIYILSFSRKNLLWFVLPSRKLLGIFLLIFLEHFVYCVMTLIFDFRTVITQKRTNAHDEAPLKGLRHAILVSF